jgi:rare lipoprotein A
MVRRLIGVGLLIVVAAGCVTVGTRRPPTQVPTRAVEDGVASWYGPGFHGRRTASGEVYDQHELTAAHRTLPIGTRVVVTNLVNGRSVEVRINDRGPFVEGRTIDLSYAAARSIGMIGTGTARVRVEVLGATGPSLPAAAYAVQVGSFASADSARELRRSLSRHFDGVYIARLDTDRRRYHRVRIGPYEQRQAAQRVAARVAELGFPAVIMEE